MDSGELTPIQDTLFPDIRRRSGIRSESGLGCLSLLDQGEQLEIRSRASPRLRGLLNGSSTLFGSAQPKSTIHLPRPRAILSGPDSDELSHERQEEKKDISMKTHISKTVSARPLSFSTPRDVHSNFAIENNIIPRSSASLEMKRTSYFPPEDVRKAQLEFEKIARLSLKKGLKSASSPFEGPVTPVSDRFEHRYASEAGERERPFASVSDDECERPFASISEELVRVEEPSFTSYSQNEETKPYGSSSPCLNKEIILQEGYAPPIDVTKEIVQRKLLPINVKKREPRALHKLEVDNSCSSSENGENRSNVKPGNRIVDKIKNLPSSPFRRGAKQQHMPTTKTTSGKVVRPWY